jgi:hypothetical protein
MIVFRIERLLGFEFDLKCSVIYLKRLIMYVSPRSLVNLIIYYGSIQSSDDELEFCFKVDYGITKFMLKNEF